MWSLCYPIEIIRLGVRVYPHYYSRKRWLSWLNVKSCIYYEKIRHIWVSVVARQIPHYKSFCNNMYEVISLFLFWKKSSPCSYDIKCHTINTTSNNPEDAEFKSRQCIQRASHISSESWALYGLYVGRWPHITVWYHTANRLISYWVVMTTTWPVQSLALLLIISTEQIYIDWLL